MFARQLLAVKWLLGTTTLLLSGIVMYLSLGLTFNRDFIQAYEQEPFGCATVDEEPLVCGVFSEEVIKNETGRAIYRNNCIQCHDFENYVVGPPLAGVQQRRSKEWLRSFVLNSTEMIEKKDSEAVALFKLYGKQQMPAFAFSTAEVDSLLEYIAAQPHR